MFIINLIIVLLGYYIAKRYPKYQLEIIFSTIIIIALYMNSSRIEKMTIDDISMESVKNIASVYNNGVLIVKDLQVTGRADINTGKIGLINIAGNKIGTTGKTALQFDDCLGVVKNDVAGFACIRANEVTADTKVTATTTSFANTTAAQIPDTLTLKSLTVGKVQLANDTIVAPTATIGKIKIRDDRVGVETKSDLKFGTCINALNYGTDKFNCVRANPIWTAQLNTGQPPVIAPTPPFSDLPPS